MATFVLIHGAFHGGWCWDRLVPLLEAAGHDALAPDLPGMGADRTPLGDVDLAMWSGAIARLVERQAQPVILVGHSRGGIVVSDVADRVSDRIAGLVYVSALMMPAGWSVLDLSAALNDIERIDLVLTPSQDGLGMVISADSLASEAYQGTDAAGLAHAVARVTPEPFSILSAVPRFGDTAARLPRAYVECANDRIVRLSHQGFMQQAWPCDPVIRLAADHSPHYSDPQALAGLLDDLARRWASPSATAD